MIDKKYNNKCDECGGTLGSSPIKGKNNTYLCGWDWMKSSGVCGNNVCFICGKIETRTEWVEDEDCCGNKIRREQKVKMFSQVERDENDPDRELHVNYCDEHKEEAQKSPLKWTDADTERIEKKKEQKKLEIEEKLGSQKGLFYCYEPFPRSVEWKREQLKGIVEWEYGCVYFWGKENDQNFFLMVPDTHPVLNDLKYTEKVKSDYDGREIEYTRYNLEKQFYTIKGVDNLPLETSDNKYEGDDPYEKAYRFSKFVGLNDKITIAEYKNQPEKEPPTENGSTDKQSKNRNAPVPNSVKEYFQKNDVKSIEFRGNHFLILYNDDKKNNGVLSLTLSINNPVFQELKEYFSKTNKNILNRQELDTNFNNNTLSTNKSLKGILWGCGIGGIVIILGTVFLLKIKKSKKK